MTSPFPPPFSWACSPWSFLRGSALCSPRCHIALICPAQSFSFNGGFRLPSALRVASPCRVVYALGGFSLASVLRSLPVRCPSYSFFPWAFRPVLSRLLRFSVPPVCLSPHPSRARYSSCLLIPPPARLARSLFISASLSFTSRFCTPPLRLAFPPWCFVSPTVPFVLPVSFSPALYLVLFRGGFLCLRLLFAFFSLNYSKSFAKPGRRPTRALVV